MKKLIAITLLLISAMIGRAQMAEPVKFTAELKTNGTAEAEIVFSGKIDAGWHVYSTNISGGPIEATFNVNKKDGIELVGKLTPRGKEISEFDNMFNMQVRYFKNSVKFVQKIRFTKPAYSINAYLEYGACNDETCMPPTQVEFVKSGKSPAVAGATEKADDKAAAEETAEVGAMATDTAATAQQALATDSAATTVPANASLSESEIKALWQPVTNELSAYDEPLNTSLLYIFLAGLAGGFLALFTPCVWPIIPMTVSFFLKRNKDRGKAIREATTYGVSIVVIYVVLGLAVTLLFGASALNALSTNAVFNIFFCLLLVVFALSFFGWFELTLPSSWTNKVDNKASSTSGLLSIFLMAFTLTLVSFSCTGPIIGFLLVEVSTSGNIIGPAVGMLGFAIALALPFTLFALFPTWLKQAPKSGGWMNTIKVVLGFIELAFALKFFSVADLAYGWGLLDREVFLALWIVIFGLLGLYLIGKLKFKSDGDSTEAMPVPCIMLGLISLAFSVYMVPGLWGAPCKAVSAFAPPMNTQDFNLYHNEVKPRFTNYEQAMATAAAEGKPVMIDFTGFGCVNCRKMEAAVWTDPQVADKLNNDFVLVSLYVDDKTPLDKTIEVVENGKKRTLRTVGDKWSYLQRSKFGANAQPFYVIIDAKGQPLAGSYSYDEDISKYMEFINKGLENYNK